MEKNDYELQREKEGGIVLAKKKDARSIERAEGGWGRPVGRKRGAGECP